MQENLNTVVLNDPKVAEKYNCTYVRNVRIHIPRNPNFQGFNGLLSNITPDAAQELVKQGHRALQPKPVEEETTE